jgi:hypothetical protein
VRCGSAPRSSRSSPRRLFPKKSRRKAQQHALRYRVGKRKKKKIN